MKHAGSSFLCGCAATSGFVLFAKQLEQLVDEDQPNSAFFRYRADDADSKFRKYDEAVGWPASAMATIKPAGGSREVVAVGPHGDFWELEPASTKESVGALKGLRGVVRSLAAVGDHVFACGMDRLVLRRERAGEWRDFGPSSGGTGVVGFEAIDGFAADDLYAVGWQGEIWSFGANGWTQVQSPVTSTLSAVCCGDDGVVYAVGKEGTLVRGRGETWAVVKTGRSENLLGVARFDGVVYAVSDFAVFQLTDAGLVEIEGAKPATCRQLLRVDGALFSMGPRDLWRKTTGAWQCIVSAETP